MQAELVTFEAPTPNEATIQTRSQKILEKAQIAVIDSPERYEQAVTFAKIIKETTALAEAERKSLTGPLNQVLDRINARFKQTFGSPLEQADTVIRGKMLAWKQAEDKRRAEEVRKAREEHEAKEKARIAELAKASEAGDQQKVVEVKREMAAQPAFIASPQKAQPIKGVSGGTASTRKVWKFEVLDQKLLPAEYLMPNERMIAAAVASGKREIVGVRIYQEESLAVR